MERRKSTRSSSVSKENIEVTPKIRQSTRVRTPSKRHEFVVNLLQSSTKRTPSKEKSNNQSQIEDVSMSEETIDENLTKLSTPFFNEQTEVAGGEIFAFNTPKKRDGMKRLADNTPKTPLSLLKSMSLNTPCKSPSSAIKTASRVQHTFSTPSTMRNKIKKGIQKRAMHSETESSADEHSDYQASEESDDSDESSDKESDASNDEEIVPKKLTNARKIMPNVTKPVQTSTRTSSRIRSKKKTYEDECIPDSDNYFMTASNKKSTTSDHTLDQLKSSRLQHEELFSLLNSIDSSQEHQQRIADMLQDLRQNFDRWMLEMQKGYNIIVYGTGSKQQLIHEFCEKFLIDKPLIVVNGFFPSLTVKDILQSIKVQLLEINTNSRNDHEVVDLISLALDSVPNAHIFLVINNIDGVMLRKTKDQHIISRLAKIKNLHLIASIDHINAPLMWDQACMDNFNFIWYDCTTMIPYKNETAFENSVFFQSSGELDLAAMNNVFRSLTTNARGIYMILVKNQIANQKDSNYQGMTFKKLYQKCRENFLVSSDSTLRTQLIEFVDHKMAKLKRSLDATELVSIPINAQILSLFAQQQNE